MTYNQLFGYLRKTLLLHNGKARKYSKICVKEEDAISAGNVSRRPTSSKRNPKHTMTRKVYVERTILVFDREKFLK